MPIKGKRQRRRNRKERTQEKAHVPAPCINSEGRKGEEKNGKNAGALSRLFSEGRKEEGKKGNNTGTLSEPKQ